MFLVLPMSHFYERPHHPRVDHRLVRVPCASALLCERLQLQKSSVAAQVSILVPLSLPTADGATPEKESVSWSHRVISQDAVKDTDLLG